MLLFALLNQQHRQHTTSTERDHMTFLYRKGAYRAPENESGGVPAPASPAPAPAPTAAPAASSAPAPSGSSSGTPTDQSQPSFTVPEAYKDKPWAAKVKSMEDVYKQIDTLDALKGKKSIAPDFSKATPVEIEEYLAQTRPADVKAYEFGKDADPQLSGALGDAMLKFGISPYQANGVIKAFQEAEKTHFTPDGMNAAFEKSFGADWKTISGQTENIIKANVSAEDKAALNKLPNPDLALVMRVVNNLVKAYGISEKGGAHTGGGTGAPQPEDINKTRNDLRTQIDGLSRKPHTADEKQELIDKLNLTYTKK